MTHRLQLSHFGPVKEADLRFGDLTILVGPQATGKSITLQLLKLLIDTGNVQDTLRHYGLNWTDEKEFLDIYFGEGMRGLLTSETRIKLDGVEKLITTLASRKGKRNTTQRLFYIPAQRVLSLSVTGGWLRGFSDYSSSDPYVVRDFSESLRRSAESNLREDESVFPRDRRLKAPLRDALGSAIFGGFALRLESAQRQKRLVLKRGEAEPLPFTVWSAGQRQFVPLLLGCYELLPGSAVTRAGDLQWVVIEEPEMGLHPQAITAVFLLVLDLLQRGYNVCMSTHSSHILDLVWAIRVIRKHNGQIGDVLKLLDLSPKPQTHPLAETILNKTSQVYYFEKSGQVRDISELDPGSEDLNEAGWGGLSGFTINDVVADVVSRFDSQAPIIEL